jgi:hypothetical protein
MNQFHIKNIGDRLSFKGEDVGLGKVNIQSSALYLNHGESR